MHVIMRILISVKSVLANLKKVSRLYRDRYAHLYTSPAFIDGIVQVMLAGVDFVSMTGEGPTEIKISCWGDSTS